MAGQTPNYKDAHPNAQQLMDEPFYFSPIEESAPFGNDDGADTFMGFCQWRVAHGDDSPLVYLREQFSEWNYPAFDADQGDMQPVEGHSLQDEADITFLIGADAAIIALAFGQLYLEGVVDAEVNQLAQTALQRQMHPAVLQLWDEPYQPLRAEQLEKMLIVLKQV